MFFAVGSIKTSSSSNKPVNRVAVSISAISSFIPIATPPLTLFHVEMLLHFFVPTDCTA